ncbi:MAG: alkaline phosphatase family protein [Acidimicrobiia bacterium]
MPDAPSYLHSGLGNLVAEIEHRLTGSSVGAGLSETAGLPDAATYVLVLFDGLGVAQLDHPEAGSLSRAMTATLEAPFPTTTSVSLATLATAQPPSRHGQVAHLAWFEEVGEVVNTLKWVTIHGDAVVYDYAGLLPEPNLWERLRSAGIEPITVQPGDFTASPLSRVLYRGARFEPAWDVGDLVEATVTLAAEPGRLLFTYVPHVDVAGHVFGLDSEEFADAVRLAVTIWEGIATGLPAGTALIGTADHGLLQFAEEQKHLVRDPRYDDLRFAGDPRGVQLWGDPSLMQSLAEETGAQLVDPVGLVGPDPTPAALSRLGTRLLLPPDDQVILPKGFDKRLRSYHGGLSRAEVEIPLLVG